MDDDTPKVRYIALLEGVKENDKFLAPIDRIRYAFHTFSLKNDYVYEPTGDVTFTSPNTDARSLDGGVERLIDAVLHLKVRAYVLSAQTAEALLKSYAHGSEIEVSPGFVRSHHDLEALVVQTAEEHEHSD